jgi:hypothetical protein
VLFDYSINFLFFYVKRDIVLSRKSLKVRFVYYFLKILSVVMSW